MYLTSYYFNIESTQYKESQTLTNFAATRGLNGLSERYGKSTYLFFENLKNSISGKNYLKKVTTVSDFTASQVSVFLTFFRVLFSKYYTYMNIFVE